MPQVNMAIVGCGKVAHIHAHALIAAKEADFVAVCDINEDSAKEFAATYNIHSYTNVAEMVFARNVEGVIVCTPHPAHAKPAIEAMGAGANVLVEKPLASTLKDCDAMIRAADCTGMVLGVMSQRRLYPPVQRVRDAIDSGKIGKPILGVVQMYGWRDKEYYQSNSWRGKWETEGGGVLVNQAPHHLDLLQWFMGPIDELFGYWGNLNHPYIEVDDTAIATIRFKSGGLGAIIVSNSQKPGLYGKVHIHGSNGASIGVQTDGGAMFIAGMSEVDEPPINDLWNVPGESELISEMMEMDKGFFKRINLTNHFHFLQVQDFIRAILKDRPPLVTGKEGRITVEIFTAIYRSQRDQKPISFPVVPERSEDDFVGY